MTTLPTPPAGPHVVVLGAGFAGLECVRRLRGSGARITLVDRQNHHLFQPLLYQVATAALSVPDIAQPVREIVRDRPDVTVLMDEVLEIRPGEKRVRLRERAEPLAYDVLVVALGAKTNFFGRDDWAAHCVGLKSLDDAQRIRRATLLAYEQAEELAGIDPTLEAQLLTTVVVGGGPTGVESAGAFAELARQNLAGDFRHIRPEDTRVLLVEASDRLLRAFAPETAANAKRQLEELGVEVRLNTKVTDIQPHLVVLGEERIPCNLILWMAGVGGSPLARQLGAPLDRAGRVLVGPDFTVPGHPEIFVVGDLAALNDVAGKPVPGTCPGALQAGEYVAKVLRARWRGQTTPPPFRFFDKGSMATIGRARAVAEVGKLRLSGFPAWLAWLFVHLIFLIGFRNQVAVFWQWVWSYVTYRRGARIVTGQDASFQVR